MYTINSEKYDNDVLKNNSAINSEQIKKLQQHVNSLNMTMSEYLKQYGFDIESIEETGRNARLSTLHDERELLPGFNKKTYYAVDMTEKNATEKGDKLMGMELTRVNEDGEEIPYQITDLTDVIKEEKPAEPEKDIFDKIGDFFSSLWPF